MEARNRDNSVDRRLMLGAGAVALVSAGAMANPVLAQQAGASASTAGTGAPSQVPITRLLAEFVAGFDVKTAPAAVVDCARIAFTDSIGVMLAGSHEEVAHIVAEMVKLEGSTPSATVVGQPFRASPQLAALANGVAGHAMDYDFTFLIGQTVAPVIPAILATAESNGASAADCVAAFIVGCEVASRISRASPRLSNDGGWHATGTIGAIAAAAACARLLKLPKEKIAHVLGTATSLASGVSANYGTMTKPLHSGNAARNGVTAAMLGAHGFTSHPAAFERAAGFFASFGRGLPLSYEPFADLRKRWDLVDVGMLVKAYPCGGRGHTAIEAALALREKIGSRLGEIDSIQCLVSPSSAQRINTNWPVDVEAAKFSAAYVIAYALVHGAPRISAFTRGALQDERVKTVAALVKAGGDPELRDDFGESPAKLKITMKSGEALEQRRDYATGSKQIPMTKAQLEAKFLDCAAAAAVSPDTARALLGVLDTITTRPSLDALWPLLRSA